MRRGTVILFARMPQLGAVKTRLAREIGPLAAWCFHRDALATLARRLAGGPGWRLEVAVTPDAFARRGRFLPLPAARRPQGRGDLGRRMARALERALRRPSDGPAVLVGCDIPELGRAQAQAALAALARADAVFGPATDGGYWLVGFRRAGLAARAFRGVRWSTADALADTLANLPKHLGAVLIEPLDDIDTAADWRRWKARL